MTILYAVIPTLGERNDTLFPMISQLQTDGVQVIVVHNEREPDDKWGSLDLTGFNTPINYMHHVWTPDETVNLSRLWNFGLDWAEKLAGEEEYVVAVLNDDLVLPPAGVNMMANSIMRHDVAAAFAAVHPHDNAVRTADTPLTLGNRMVGYAFALRGSKKLQADESFLWWWGDTDLDLRARRAGGVVAVWLEGLQHKDPNGYTNRRPELYEQAGRDRETFRMKHGFLPW